MPRRFPHLRGDSRLYPFAARTALRRRQKHRAWALRLCGAAVLCLAAGLILRDTVFRGGQPEAPVTTAESTEQPSPTPIAIEDWRQAFGAQNRRVVTVLAGVLALLCGGGGAVFAPLHH